MIDHTWLVEDWRRAVERYRRLSEFGFIEGPPVERDGQLREVRFSSQHLFFVVGVDILRGERYGGVFDAKTGVAIPDLRLALCYFLSSLDDLISRYKAAQNAEQEFEVTLSLYRENRWVIQANGWLQDKGFLDALDKANQWVWKEMREGIRPLKRWEFERTVHAHRGPNVQIPSDGLH